MSYESALVRDQDGTFAIGNAEGQKFTPGNQVASKYLPDIHPKIIREAAKRGATAAEIAACVGVSRETLNQWRHRFTAVSDALKTGRDYADDRVERALYERALGYHVPVEHAVKLKNADGSERIEVVTLQKFCPPSTTAQIFWLKNRRRKEWLEGRSDGDLPKQVADMTELTDEQLRAIASIPLRNVDRDDT